ncbi:TonB-dependent hemoglobin/transferrin/lactoferrin family receptor [Colwellia asteriadis]|uniref:TonB-dependent hemoglobin/transferrin/lactoferrin family receptor n=1 Tax=Colwellia asteriadis TaxID=517723 RepID=A0ABP3WIR8_9GAMM
MRCTYSFLALSIFTACLPAQAQALNNDQKTLNKTVVEGEKKLTASNERVLNMDEIERRNIENIYDLADSVAGVEVADLGRFGANGFTIRGMDSDRVAILVDGMSQGESLDPPGFGPYEFFSSGRNGAEIEHMKSVTIVKGADSVRSGSGALGGAVLFETKSAADYITTDEDDTVVSIKAGYDGRNAEQLYSAALANNSGDFSTLFMVTKRDGEETKSHSDGENISGSAREIPDPLATDRLSFLFKSSYQLTAAQNFGIVFEQSDASSDLNNLSRVTQQMPARWTEDESNRKRMGAFYTWQANNVAFDELSWELNYQELFTQGVTNMLYAGCLKAEGRRCVEYASPYLRQENRNFTQENLKFDFDLSKDFATGSVKHDLVYGFSYEDRSLENVMWDHRWNGATPDSGYRPLSRPKANGQTHYPERDASFVPQTDVAIINLYLRDSIALTDALTVNAGLRYDNTQYKPQTNEFFQDDQNLIKDVDISALSWQLSAIYAINNHHSVFFDANQGYKAPTVQDVYYGSRGASEDNWTTLPNYNLDVETATNLELAYQWQNESAFIKASIFKTQYDDFIEYTTLTRELAQPKIETYYDRTTHSYKKRSTTTDEYQMPVNVGKASSQGFEVEAQWEINDSNSLQASYSNVNGEYEDGDPMESISPSSAIIAWVYSADKWNLRTQLRHTAEKKPSDAYKTNSSGEQEPVSDYLSDTSTVLDMHANIYLTDDLTLNIAVRNITDENYYSWQKVRRVSNGSGGFRGGVSDNGINRYSEPGRSISANISYQF